MGAERVAVVELGLKPLEFDVWCRCGGQIHSTEGLGQVQMACCCFESLRSQLTVESFFFMVRTSIFVVSAVVLFVS